MTGSTLIETKNAYINLQRKIREKEGFFLAWITDGSAWQTMKTTVAQCFREIDFPMNYTIASEKLDRVVSELV